MLETVVMKFGGTSVGTVERIAEVAKRVLKKQSSTGKKVVVVVSAMAGETDRLVKLCRAVAGGNRFDEREYSQLVVSGEQISSALMALALQREGAKAMSLTAYQIPLETRRIFGKQLISDVRPDRLVSLLNQGIIPVVTGFQGIDEDGSFTTLGRGGSDTTAVAIAAALKSEACEIYTDVDGVYSASPSVCKNAKKLSHLTYEEMLELASSGAKVLQTRSVDLARKYAVRLLVKSSFTDADGTEIVEEYANMENAVVSGINCRSDEAKITLRRVPDYAGNAAKIFKCLGEAGVVVDIIVQSEGAAGFSDIAFTVAEDDVDRSVEAITTLIESKLQGVSIEVDTDVAKLSVVGEGMRNHAGVAAEMFEVLGREGINIKMITTSEIKISVGIERKYAELAVRVLHEYFIENESDKCAQMACCSQ